MKNATKSKVKKAPKKMGGGRKLRCAKGYSFKKVGRNGVALMRQGVKVTTFTCECSLSGGCRVQMEDQTAICLESGCTGSCGWVVNVPGILGNLNGLTLAKR
jgi:hypothetical protein